jgi:hypothetical protein
MMLRNDECRLHRPFESLGAEPRPPRSRWASRAWQAFPTALLGRCPCQRREPPLRPDKDCQKLITTRV